VLLVLQNHALLAANTAADCCDTLLQTMVAGMTAGNPYYATAAKRLLPSSHILLLL
jgi:hypothetical protein